MVITENEKKEYIKQVNMRSRTIHPEAFKKTLGKWREKHPNYMKEWNEKHPNYMKDYMKEWKSNMKRINAGSTKKIEGVDLVVVSELDKSIYREIDEPIRKESASTKDEL